MSRMTPTGVDVSSILVRKKVRLFVQRKLKLTTPHSNVPESLTFFVGTRADSYLLKEFGMITQITSGVIISTSVIDKVARPPPVYMDVTSIKVILVKKTRKPVISTIYLTRLMAHGSRSAIENSYRMEARASL